MDKVYQVFVSSTYADLADERRRVSETLAKAGFIPAGMELFPATDQKQLDFIKRVIDRCDYYVVVVGGRYGSLADEQISFTESEYNYAIERQIPVLAFLHSKPEKIEVGKTDLNEGQARKLIAFRDRLAKGRIVDFWAEPQELCTKVVIAIAQAINLSPGVGWIRGDLAIDPKVLQELERVRIENDKLRSRIAELETSEVTFPPHLAGPEDNVPITISILRGQQREELSVDITPRYVFETGVDSIIREISEILICERLAKIYVVEHFPEKLPPGTTCSIAAEDVKKLRFHMEALGLIKAESRQGSSTKYIAWTITEKGRRYIANLKAIQKQ